MEETNQETIEERRNFVKNIILAADDVVDVRFVKKDGSIRNILFSKIELAKWYEQKRVEEESNPSEHKLTRKLADNYMLVREILSDGTYANKTINLDTVNFVTVYDNKTVVNNEILWT